MMKYERPDMSVVELDENSVIFTSLDQGGTSGEGDGDGIDWDL